LSGNSDNGFFDCGSFNIECRMLKKQQTGKLLSVYEDSSLRRIAETTPTVSISSIGNKNSISNGPILSKSYKDIVKKHISRGKNFHSEKVKKYKARRITRAVPQSTDFDDLPALEITFSDKSN